MREPTSAFIKVMIMMCQTEGAQKRPVMMMFFHCQGPIFPRQANT